MDECLITGKASPRSERTEVQRAYGVGEGRQAETGTPKERVPFELLAQIISYINSIPIHLLRKYLYIH